MKRYLLAAAILCAGAVLSCEENSTTAPDLGFSHVNPRTVEVLIPFEDFVDEVQVFGGYGSTVDLRRGAVALDVGGLNARALVHLNDFPTSAPVPGSGADSDLSFKGGRVVLTFDTLTGSLEDPVNVELFDVGEEWHARTVSWELAVDTAGDQRAWTQPGGGPINLLGGATFDANVGPVEADGTPLVDTVSVAVDSATVAALGDPNSGTTGLLLAVADPGELLNLLNMRLVINTVPASRPDTVLELSVSTRDLTFMLDPAPTAPAGWLRVGGVPAWRSVMTMSLPNFVPGPAEICGSVGCQVDLTEVDLNLAELVLTTRQTESAYQPTDTAWIDIRRVLNPELLPKSPLGGRLVPTPVAFAPDLFSWRAGEEVLFGVTDLVGTILFLGRESGTIPVTSIVLFNLFEPDMLGFVSFEGGGGAGAPALKLLYTFANDVGLP